MMSRGKGGEGRKEILIRVFQGEPNEAVKAKQILNTFTHTSVCVCVCVCVVPDLSSCTVDDECIVNKSPIQLTNEAL